jgi:nucleoid-associated protein YgaU
MWIAWLGMLVAVLVGFPSHRTMASQLRMPQTPPVADSIHPRVVESAGYITPAPTLLATIFHSLEDRQHVAAADRMVIDAGEDKQLSPGMQLTVVRLVTAVSPQAASQLLGTTVVIMGTAIVERVQPTTAILRILYAFDAIQPGDFVKPFVPPQPVVANTAYPPQTSRLRGTIVATKDDKVAVGLGDIVYLDQGKQHGVALGDRFNILWGNHTVEHPVLQTVSLPPQILGTLDIIEVRNRTSTGLITASQREFAVGDPVELRLPFDDDQAAARRRESEPVVTSLVTQAVAYRSRLLPCLEAARQALHAAAAAGVKPAELSAAQQALRRAEAAHERAAILLDQGQTEQAVSELRLLESDCLSAQELSTEARLLSVSRIPEQPEQYRVRRGDTLWSISGQEVIYRNSLLWPILYQANRQQLRDPDLIFPQQILAVPRHLSQEEMSTAIRRARTRGGWRQGDGRDVYVLEGTRR